MKYVAYGGDGDAASLHIQETEAPRPGAGEILIRVQAAGVNRPDVLQRQGKYAPPPDASPILGLEVAGTVAAVGADVDEWQVGDRVCALVPGGGYAEYCVTPARHALPIPAGLSLEAAAGLPEVWFTVWANLVDLAQLRAGEWLLVHGGASGIGLAALQLATHLNARPIVTVGSEDKARFCRDFGACAAIEYHRDDFVERSLALTGGEGVDVVLDMVGAAYLERNLRVLRQDGRLVLIGFMQGSRGQIDLRPVLAKRLRLTGSAMRPRSIAEKAAIRAALLQHIWPAIAAGRIRSHVHAVFPLAQASEAHRLMESGRHVGKIVLRVAG
ncbi:MAG TPA: NAD(P)H-quinone oxidoreductase [Steroidobacteraceae bacterium]|nr:NAD(P)H-quinone oxidoreductase [Steroidobacteraceae bacterium]